jgi:hypothetical protein
MSNSGVMVLAYDLNAMLSFEINSLSTNLLTVALSVFPSTDKIIFLSLVVTSVLPPDFTNLAVDFISTSISD